MYVQRNKTRASPEFNFWPWEWRQRRQISLGTITLVWAECLVPVWLGYDFMTGDSSTLLCGWMGIPHPVTSAQKKKEMRFFM
jgi:hypothetical protein